MIWRFLDVGKSTDLVVKSWVVYFSTIAFSYFKDFPYQILYYSSGMVKD